MDRHSIVLRPANPTFDEGLACARYVDAAAEGFFRFWLGRDAGGLYAPAHQFRFGRVDEISAET